MVTAWCQFCENRGHLPAHHKEYDQIRLINMYLATEAFNLKTGFKLLTGGKEDFQRIKYVHWRCGLYTSSKEEVPKYHRMQPEWDTSHLGEPEKPAGPDPKRQLNKRIYDLQLKLRTGCTSAGRPYKEHDLNQVREKLQICYDKKAAMAGVYDPTDSATSTAPSQRSSLAPSQVTTTQLHTALGEIRFSAPATYQVYKGDRIRNYDWVRTTPFKDCVPKLPLKGTVAPIFQIMGPFIWEYRWVSETPAPTKEERVAAIMARPTPEQEDPAVNQLQQTKASNYYDGRSPTTRRHATRC